MLLWNDSLEYRSTALLGNHYVSAVGFNVGVTGHPLPGRTQIQATGGTLLIAPPVDTGLSAGSETCIVGFLLTQGTLTGQAPFFDVLSGGNPQVSVRIQPSGSKVQFVFRTGDNLQTLVTSSAIDLSVPRYIEIFVKATISGTVALRVNGIEDCRAEFVPAAFANPLGGWSRVQFTAQTIGGMKLADLYICDGRANPAVRFSRFLGPVLGRRLSSTISRDDFFGLGFEGRKTNLQILWGQSNNNGRGLLPHPNGTAPWRSPNTKILVWDKVQGAPAFRPLEAGVNTRDFFVVGSVNAFWGPEMMLAELTAQLYERSGETGTPPIRMMKMCQDASLVAEFPGQPLLSWSPNQPGSLFHLSMAEIDAAVATLGGWSNIGSVDSFWYQGEGEASFELALGGLFNTLSLQFFDAVQNHIPVPVRWHRVRIHKDLTLNFFPFRDGVRGMQRASGLPGDMLDVDDFLIGVDSIHLAPRSYDALGEVYYRNWFNKQLTGLDIADYRLLNAIDTINLGRNTPGKSDFDQHVEGQFNLINDPCLALSSRAHAQAPAGSSDLVIETSGANGPVINVTNPTGWTAKRASVEGILAPEAAAKPLRLRKP